jgi:hypothetical protein
LRGELPLPPGAKRSASLPCGRRPHQIKISPHDKEHVWIIDDRLHMMAGQILRT